MNLKVFPWRRSSGNVMYDLKNKGYGSITTDVLWVKKSQTYAYQLLILDTPLY
jgi:hypothetical protein